VYSNNKIGSSLRLAGYAALIERYKLDVIPNWRKSYISTTTTHRIDLTGRVTEEVYPSKYWPGDGLGDHLEFALKYDGTNLLILDALFQKTEVENIVEYIKSKPTGKYARRIWFLFEFLTQNKLPLEDVKKGNYIDLLDREEYYASSSVRQMRRQRINDNLLGDNRFCPMIRRTEILRKQETANLAEKCRKLISNYPAHMLKRALSYLYTKETKSSFEIEHIKPTSSRTERFVALLHEALFEDFCDKPALIELQNRIVDQRFRNSNYRRNQNYVGETVAWQNEKIHFVSPKPEDLEDLMEGLISSHKRMGEGKVSAVIHAAAIAYGFVFLHPFEDGNGRIHRFLIHNILSKRGFTPQGIIVPVSAFMLKNIVEYDASLESYSKPLIALIDYSLDEEGRMTIQQDTATFYRYIDMTPQAEALFYFIGQTIETELANELSFLANYDITKSAIQEIVDMPDRKIDLFIRFCLQNNGRLSATKRKNHFDFLSEEEINKMEQAVQSAYGDNPQID
jgi:hypothetical protein